MKITRRQLRRLIKEELNLISEQSPVVVDKPSTPEVKTLLQPHLDKLRELWDTGGEDSSELSDLLIVLNDAFRQLGEYPSEIAAWFDVLQGGVDPDVATAPGYVPGGWGDRPETPPPVEPGKMDRKSRREKRR